MRTHYVHIGKLRKNGPKFPYSRKNLMTSSEYLEQMLSHLPAKFPSVGLTSSGSLHLYSADVYPRVDRSSATLAMT